MYYSEDLVEEIRLKNDIVDVISGYVKLQKKGSSYFGLCPFHNEKSPSFSVSRSKQMYYCFGCGAGGNVFTFIMEYENYTFAEALKFLAERAGVELPEIEYSNEAKEKANLKATLLEINKLAAKYFYAQLKTELLAGKPYWFSSEEEEEIQQHNASFYQVCPEEELFRARFRAPQTSESYEELSLVDILDELRESHAHLLRHVDYKQFGAALVSAGIERVHTRFGNRYKVTRVA